MTPLYELPDLYDAQYLRYRDDVPHYLRLAQDTGGPVLELGAGSGRLTLALARAGFEVTGVDTSEQMLARAREAIEEGGVEESVRLVPEDMRTLDLERTYPLAIAPFNTLMHLFTVKDQDAALAAIAGHLAPGGRFAFDLFTPRFGHLGVLRREAEWADVGGEQSELFVLQEHDAAAQVIVSRYYLDRVAPEGGLTRRTAILRQRYFTRFELERALRSAGFARLSLYGDFAGRPFGAESRHMVGIASLT